MIALKKTQTSFLQELLNVERAPIVSKLFLMEKTETLGCARLGCAGAKVVEGDRELTCLTVKVHNGPIGVERSVQEVIVDSSRGEVMESDFRWACPEECGCPEAVKSWDVTKTPEVLWVRIVAQAYDRKRRRVQKAPHSIMPSAELVVGGQQYELASCVFHHGEGFRTGHYNAICRTRQEARSDGSCGMTGA